MYFKKTTWYSFSRSVEVEADSLEEAMEMFEDGDWYDDEPQDVDHHNYFKAILDDDGEIDDWDEVEEE